MQRFSHTFLMIGLCFTLTACIPMLPNIPGLPGGDDNGDAQPIQLTANLTADQQSMDVTSDATGNATMTLNADQTELSYIITASGLTGASTVSHFHNAPAGQDGDVVFDIGNAGNVLTDGGGSYAASGTWPITSEQVTELLAGNIYINIHTDMFPAGEIRGQVTEAE